MVVDKISENYKKAVVKEMKAASPAVKGTDNVATLRQSIEARRKLSTMKRRLSGRKKPYRRHGWHFFYVGPPGLKWKAMMAAQSKGADGRLALHAMKLKEDPRMM